MGELFGTGQSQANEWVHTLLPVLKQALDDLEYEPAWDPKKSKKSEQGHKDGVETMTKILFPIKSIIKAHGKAKEILADAKLLKALGLEKPQAEIIDL